MHFWIDKRSQTCGFSGRHRVPSSLSASGGGRRRWRGAKPMVTPVHRFQPIECVTGQYVPSNNARRYTNRQLCLPPPAYRLDTVLNGHTISSSELPMRANAVELDSSVFLDLPIDGSGEVQSHIHPPQLEPVGKLKCGMWTSFAIATIFVVAGAKFFLDHRGTELEVLLFSVMMSLLLLGACLVSLCRSKSTRDLLSVAVTASAAHVPTQAPQMIPSLQVIHPTTVEETTTQIHPPHIEPPPPPYHIAILLPQQVNQEEVPPPPYDKAVS